jgi:cell division protein FtsA
LAHGYNEALSSPIYATAIGLLMKGIEDHGTGLVDSVSSEVPQKDEQEPVEEVVLEQGERWYEQIFKKTKEWFETEPDPDM